MLRVLVHVWLKDNATNLNIEVMVIACSVGTCINIHQLMSICSPLSRLGRCGDRDYWNHCHTFIFLIRTFTPYFTTADFTPQPYHPRTAPNPSHSSHPTTTPIPQTHPLHRTSFFHHYHWFWEFHVVLVHPKTVLTNRKWQDYVYIQCEYKSTKQKIKHLLREENKVKENKIS